jgi:hypothetical protein
MESVLNTFLVFVCCPIVCLYVLGSVLWCPLQFPDTNDVQFVFISSCLLEGSCLIYVICAYLRIVMSSKYCVVFLLCFCSSCVPMLPVYLVCPFLIAPSVLVCVYWCSANIVLCFCFVFMFVLCPHVTSLSSVSIFDCPFGFSNVYLPLYN